MKNSSTKILVVDDSEVIRRIMIKIFKQGGYNIEVAANGEEAIEAVKETEFHLIIMDLEMPVMNGFKATQAIRKFEKENNKKHVPIIAFSSSDSEEHQDEFLILGMNDHIEKSIKLSQLKELIKKWV